MIYIAGSFGLLGAYDDYKKIMKNNSSGVSSKFKIVIQIILALIGILIYYFDYVQSFRILGVLLIIGLFITLVILTFYKKKNRR